MSDFEDRLLARVVAAFPALPVGNSRIESTGGDHILLIVDDRYAFRFPRAGKHDLKLEIELLAHLQHRSTLPTPSYDYIDPAGKFAGYRFIDGVPLTCARFDMLPAGARDRILGEAALFLSSLHGLPIEAICPPSSWPKAWTAAEFAERGLAQRLPSIARHAPHLAPSIAAFYDRYRHDRPHHSVVIHGDLVADHILLDERTGSLAGIIDFGDVALGDPAQDFLGFWPYGADAVARLAKLYLPSSADTGLLRRSRNHFIRYRIDRFCEDLDEEVDVDPARGAAEIEALLNGLE